MTTLADRTRTSREKAGFSQQELAEQVGISQQSIAKIESGVTSQPRKIKELASVLGVSADWLQFGKSEVNAENSGLVIKEWEDTSPDPYIFVEIPLLDIELSAGDGSEAEVIESETNTYPLRREELRSSGVSVSDARMVRILGNSLFPVLTNGDKVAVDLRESHPVRDGDLYAIRDGVLLRVKILVNLPNGGIVLKSYNKDEYPDEILNYEERKSRIHIIGRVFWSSRRW